MPIRAAGRLAAHTANLDPRAHRLQIGVEFGLVRRHGRPVQAGGAVELGRHAQRLERCHVGRRARDRPQGRVVGRKSPARRHGQRREVTQRIRVLVDERDDPLGADGAQLRHRRVPPLAPAADQPEQLFEGRDAGVGQACDQVRRKPALERVVRARRLDQGGLHARQRGVLALAQTPVARDLAIDRGRACRRIRLEIEREQVPLAVDVVRVDRVAEGLERGRHRRLAFGTIGTTGVRLGRQTVRFQSQQVDGISIARAARGASRARPCPGRRSGLQRALLERLPGGPIER